MGLSTSMATHMFKLIIDENRILDTLQNSYLLCSFGLVKSYSMPMSVESAALFPSRGKFIAGGDDMWVRLFDFDTGNEIGEFFVNDPGIPFCSLNFLLLMQQLSIFACTLMIVHQTVQMYEL